MASPGWVSLFSGGKDSSWALYQAMERGLPVERLLTVHPEGDSYMYHVPATELATLAAESIGISLLDVEPGDLGAREATDAGDQGDAEVEPLRVALGALDAELAGGVAGVTVGAVESEYQASRIEGLADELDIDVFAPLWHADPGILGREMFYEGFEIVIIQVAADGLDESWLGRTLDPGAFSELETLREEYGIHILGEGGEFETLVTDGPHMERPIELDYETRWDGTRGSIDVQDAWLGDP